jgi:hypothetical protein
MGNEGVCQDGPASPSLAPLDSKTPKPTRLGNELEAHHRTEVVGPVTDRASFSSLLHVRCTGSACAGRGTKLVRS